MDIQKLRYDLAMQVAMARLTLEQSTETSPHYDCEQLLGIFAQCYSDCLKIPKSHFDLLLKES